MRVIGTAGHVDHGKSTLVEALSGTNPDRLREEQQREMTIELGFAWMTLPNGEEVGIVDVPGHRDFIENMLAGVGGIDAVLLIVAADEGVMPQTREHLAIMDLLEVPGGIVVISKADLISDNEWFELVELDVRKITAGTVLENAPLVRVSARSGTGIGELKSKLEKLLSKSPPRLDLGRPRLPIDRVFTIAGFGTVVTGTLLDGSLKLGEEVEIQPTGLRARIRGLQTHKKKEEIALPGSRTAINISGIQVDQVERGHVVIRPGEFQPSRRLDASFRMLKDAKASLKHNSTIKFFQGTDEVMGRVRVLGGEELMPGETGWIQLELSHPVVAVRQDHYILRRPSPPETLGGGLIIDPAPIGRHSRYSSSVQKKLSAMVQGAPEEVLLQVGQSLGVVGYRELIDACHLGADAADTALKALLASGELVLVSESDLMNVGNESLVVTRTNWEEVQKHILELVGNFHKTSPLRYGIPREELKSRLKSRPSTFTHILRRMIAEGKLQEAKNYILLPGHTIELNEAQSKSVNRLLERFAISPYAPPGIKECQFELGIDLYRALIDLNILVEVSSEVVFRRQDYEEMLQGVTNHLKEFGSITVSQFRDRFESSRKYALGFLEHLDAIGITVREGDYRKLKNTSLKVDRD